MYRKKIKSQYFKNVKLQGKSQYLKGKGHNIAIVNAAYRENKAESHKKIVIK